MEIIFLCSTFLVFLLALVYMYEKKPIQKGFSIDGLNRFLIESNIDVRQTTVDMVLDGMCHYCLETNADECKCFREE